MEVIEWNSHPTNFSNKAVTQVFLSYFWSLWTIFSNISVNSEDLIFERLPKVRWANDSDDNVKIKPEPFTHQPELSKLFKREFTSPQLPSTGGRWRFHEKPFASLQQGEIKIWSIFNGILLGGLYGMLTSTWNWEPQAGGIPFLRGRERRKGNKTLGQRSSLHLGIWKIWKRRDFLNQTKSGAGNKRIIWGISFSFLITRT